MRWGFVAFFLPALLAAQAQAQSLPDALIAAYQNNPGLMAERAKLRATDEKVPEALSHYRPNIEAGAGIGRSRQNASGMSDKDLTPQDIGVTIKQPLFRGFRTVAATDVAEAEVKAGRAALENAEQNLLYEAAKAYLDLLRSQKVFELTKNNEDVLRENLRATEERFKIGEVTKTDISQSEARLSAATAQRIRAEGTLAGDGAAYLRVIGTPPQNLQAPQIRFNAPERFDEIVEKASTQNPAIIAATHGQEAARAGITLAQGALLPEISLVGSLSHAREQNIMMPERQNEATIMARLTLPLYGGGADYARSRAAYETATQKRFELEDIRARVRELATRAWQNLKTAQAALRATQSQKEAAELALHGVREEQKAGTRTVLDVLNAEQEVLSANVDWVQAAHDETLAMLQIKAALGELTAGALALKVETYDPDAHYQKVRGKWIGLGSE